MDAKMVHGPEVHFDRQTGAPLVGHHYWVEISENHRAEFYVGSLEYEVLRKSCPDVEVRIKERIARYAGERLTRNPDWAPISEIQLDEHELA